MPPLLPPKLIKAYQRDQQLLAATDIPIVTITGTSREDLQKFYHPGNLTDDLGVKTTDVIFSRAHFSMALAVATQIWGKKIEPKKAWLVDPTNYVSPQQWLNVEFTEEVGKTIARHDFLKYVKDMVDRFGRNKLPILESITPPLLYLTQHVKKPILSFHIAAGNILAEQGKDVVQVVTDPQVRQEYVKNAARPNIHFCVYDDRTKLEFLEVAASNHVAANPERIIVTGPPIDPRVVAARKHKAAWRSGVLRLCVTTGGLGTNKVEIQKVLEQLLPQLHHHPLQYQVLVYAGTQKDIAEMVEKLAKDHHVSISPDHDVGAKLRLLYHPHILEANELLIRYGFPWADGFITKPSGDMAYDAVAAGCFLLTLKEWGVWEERIREIFEQKDIARRADTGHIVEQLHVLRAAPNGISWIEYAMNHAFNIEKLFLLGAKKIAEVATTKTGTEK